MSITISKALNAAGAVKYFKDEYEHARGSYYSEDEMVVGQWSGQLADHFGLKGAVNRTDFEKLAEGQDPRDDAQLIRRVKPHARTNQYGEEIETNGHRAGFDVTFSAPKSVSLAAIVGGDERIRDAHSEAVREALQEIETYAQARLGGNRPAETTGKLLFASFQHDAARPDRKDGYAAPDLHTHNFAFNLTQTSDGKIKSLQPREIYKCQQYGKAMYRAKLAENLQKLGYEIQVDKRTSAPEIAGISREYIEASSPRQREIKEAQQALGANSTREIAARNRRTKVYDREDMKERHQELDRQHGGQAHAVAQDAREQVQTMSALLWDERGSETKARESVTFAIQKGSERKAVADIRELMVDALRRNLGHTTVEAIKAEMQVRQDKGQLVGLVLDDATKQRMTTQRILEMESANIEKVRAGQGTQQPTAKHIAGTPTNSQGVTLNESQRAAVEQIVTSRDQITGLQGGAGTGKTTTLAAVRDTAERAGYDVQGFAPTTRATQLLAESGMQTRTLQKFLRQKLEPDAPRRFYVLDESSLASTKAVNSFLSRVRPEDRVLLVGDVKQHEAIEAGSPFAQLQRHGMATAKLEKIVRQKDAPLREVIEKLSIGKIKQAVEGLREQGRITEIADPRGRLKAIAKDYCEQPANALVISPANKERVELNQLIHEQLQSTGQISKQDYRTKVLENRNELTGAERTFAAVYHPNDVIRYTSASRKHDIGAGEYARVISTSDKDNTITVKLDKSQREVTYNPQRLQGVAVYREAEREFATGDRLQFRAPYHSERVANGELGTLEKIEKGTLTVALDSGRKVSFPIEKNRHIDHGYAVTSHSSQGQTIDRVLINADTRESDKLLNQRMAYVAGSRARLDARIYTDSAERLSAALARQVDKSTALEERRETEPLNVARLVPIEKTVPTLQPTQEARPESRPPAQRAPQPAQSEAVQWTPREQEVLTKFDEVVRLVNNTYQARSGNTELKPEIKLAIAEQAAESSLRPVVETQLALIAHVAEKKGDEPPVFGNRVDAAVWLVKQCPAWREEWTNTMYAAAQDKVVARVLTQNRLAELAEASAEKRARDFEGTSHLRRVHIEGHDRNEYSKSEKSDQPRDANYQWSLMDVAIASREAKKNEADYNRKAVHYEAQADLSKLVKNFAKGHLNPLTHVQMGFRLITHPVDTINSHFNPVKIVERDPLVQIGRFVYEAAGARKKAAELRELAKAEAEKAARLETAVRPEVIKQTDVARAGVRTEITESRELTRGLNSTIEKEVTARAATNTRMPKASFREEEIREVGARAMELSDSAVLKQYEKLAQAGQASGLLQEESLAARAGARQTVAAARVLEAQVKLAEFSKAIGTDGMTVREVTPVKVEIEGEVRVMTLRDAINETEAIKELIELRLAATEESLRAKVTKRRGFYETARSIATEYDADLAARAGVESVRPPLPQFSAVEYTEIENFAASIKDAGLHKRFTEISESAIKDNRVIGSEKAVDAALDPVLKLDEEIGTGAAAEDRAIASAAPEINAVDGLMKTPSPALDALQRNAVSETIEKTITGELQKTINELLQKRASYVPPPVPDTIPLRPYTLIEPSDAAEDLSMTHTSLNDSLSHSEAIENRPQAASTEQAIGSEAATEEIELEEFIEAGIEM